jgi:hypothetical protein
MKRILLSTLGLIVVLMVAFAPRSTMAGAANGPSYPSPSWDQKLVCATPANCPRFVVLLNWSSAAVLDKETGLVWERSPSTSVFTWDSAQMQCNTLTTGGRLGWRLPTLQELTSLADPTQNFALPPGHPFKNVQLDPYWSATSSASSPGDAWAVTFNLIELTIVNISSSQYVWCARGGQGVDPQ